MGTELEFITLFNGVEMERMEVCYSIMPCAQVTVANNRERLTLINAV